MCKVVVLDWSIFMFRGIFAWRNRKEIPATWYSMNMIISTLQKIGIDKDDLVIVAGDGRNSWRKDYEQEYKKNRKAFRESFEDVDWNKMYNDYDYLLEKIREITNFHVIKIDRLEADDIGAVVSRYYKDKEIILVSYDQDWEQMLQYNNVKIWSILLKNKKGKGAYKIKPKNFNAYMLLSKKIEKEVSDNLINPILNEKDYNNRMLCVNLLELPEFVENQIKEKLDEIKSKEWGDIEQFPFPSIRKKLEHLYDKDKVITYEECLVKKTKKKKKRG